MDAEKAIDSRNGAIKISTGESTPGVNTANGTVARINLPALSYSKPGADNILLDFIPGSAFASTVIKDAGLGTNILGAIQNARFAVDFNPANTIYVSEDGLCSSHNRCWPNIQNGIASVSGRSIIEITQETYNENIILDFDQVILLQGGWDANFTSSSSYTTINGSITVTNGTMIFEYIILE